MYNYYRFMNKFHVEPKDWLELIEYQSYVDTEVSVDKLIADLTKQEK